MGAQQATAEQARGRIAIEAVGVQFAGRAAVAGVDLDIAPGEFVCLLGPSGCGKSTLLNAVAGFVAPSAGQVRVDGVAVAGPSAERGMVFQHYALFPWKTVLENVAFGPRMRGSGRRAAREQALAYLEVVGLAHVAGQYPATLSGGMQQRVGIARALVNRPSVLLLDEPFGALDAQTRTAMQENLLAAWAEIGNTVLFVTHDVDEALTLADRVVVMSAAPGRVLLDLPVALPRPRPEDAYALPEFAAAKRACLHLIRSESRRAFENAGGDGV